MLCRFFVCSCVNMKHVYGYFLLSFLRTPSTAISTTVRPRVLCHRCHGAPTIKHSSPGYGATLISSRFSFKNVVFFNNDGAFICPDSYMKPLLTHSRPTLLETLPNFCNPVARLLTTTEQLTQVFARQPSDESHRC